MTEEVMDGDAASRCADVGPMIMIRYCRYRESSRTYCYSATSYLLRACEGETREELGYKMAHKGGL